MDDLLSVASASTLKSCKLIGTKSIGVDYGLARTGVAVSIGYEPQPITILSKLNVTQTCSKILQYCKSENAHQIIVGLPLHKNGTEALQTTLTRNFAQTLACCALAQCGPDKSPSIYLWDERYTSKEAAARLLNKNAHQNLYKQLDADAACIILENYYDENGKGAQIVTVNENMKEICLQAWNIQQQEDEQRKLQEATMRKESSRGQRRQEAMERAHKLEESMARDGTLKPTTRKKKKKKRKRK